MNLVTSLVVAANESAFAHNRYASALGKTPKKITAITWERGADSIWRMDSGKKPASITVAVKKL